MTDLKVKHWTSRTPNRWMPVEVAGTDECVALVAPDRRDLATAIEAIPKVHELLGDIERLVEVEPVDVTQVSFKVREALAKLEGR